MYRIAAFFVAASLVACNENGLSQLPVPIEVQEPIIELDPSFIDFGVVSPGADQVRVVTVRNIGDDVLNFNGWDYQGSDSFIVVDADQLPARLQVGEAAAFQVRARINTSGELSGQAVIYSDDPDTPEARLDIVARGSGPSLRISPDPYDFHTVFVGCSDDVDLTLANTGDAELRIDDIAFDTFDHQFSLSNSVSLPLTIAPGGFASITVAFDALRAGLADSVLNVTSNDPRGLVQATQLAEASFASQRTDRFTMPSNPAVDILFAIDQSCSMDTHSANLANNFQTFINSLGQVTSNWQIGVITEASACKNDTIFRSSTTNLVSRFTSAVAQGVQHDTTEKLFLLTQSALARTTPGGCNAGLLRDDAFLHVVLVSDEYEQSTVSPGTFVTNVWSYKDSPNDVAISGIICPDHNCNGSQEGTNAGYREAVLQGGGQQLDIMTRNWGASAQALAQASVEGIGRFELSGSPDQSTLSVSVNGSVQSSGWHFDAASNEVVFEPLPAANASIQISYGLHVGCP